MTSDISRRTFMAGVGATAAALSAEGRAAQPATRPNVLLYVVDDQGTDDAGCYGNPVIRTPGQDMLAAEGTRFTRAFCTTPSCSASRSTILTGWHNHANGMYGLAHSYHHFQSFDNVKTLPVMLSDAGYRTARAGKYHVAPPEAYRFDEAFAGKSPVDMADNCRDFVTGEDDRPFFLYFCTTEPHRPFRRDGSQPIDPADVIVPDYLPDTKESREELAQYYMSVERADSGLARLIEILKEAGQWDNTLVVYISDNGIAFPGAKTNLYEPGMRLPCIVRSPRQKKKGHACDAMITWTYITPTILDFCDAMPENHVFHGRSFLAALEEEHPRGFDEIYASHTFHEVTMYYPMRVVRGRRYKLIWNIASGLAYPFAQDLYASATWRAMRERGEAHYGKRSIDAYMRRPPFELYDLEEDPHEINNLADSPEHATILAELKEKLRAFQERTNDPWIHKWEYE
ncbi:MAG TPA: DUF4976 domain-containing protein [Candidatus Hydrogenedentes bacterium]|nr:DUF4976 domain-containing protein [Candidatus Hydrogenedentota bacterium]